MVAVSVWMLVTANAAAPRAQMRRGGPVAFRAARVSVFYQGQPVVVRGNSSRGPGGAPVSGYRTIDPAIFSVRLPSMSVELRRRSGIGRLQREDPRIATLGLDSSTEGME